MILAEEVGVTPAHAHFVTERARGAFRNSHECMDGNHTFSVHREETIDKFGAITEVSLVVQALSTIPQEEEDASD